MNLSDMGPKTGERKNNPFQPIRSTVGHVSRAGQFDLSSENESEALKEAQARTEARRESLSPRKKPVKLFLIVGVAILVIGLLSSSIYFYYQYSSLKEEGGKEEIALYLKQLEKMVVLPKGEEPTLATVTDKEKLSGQSFFANAQNGDKMLVFSKSNRAILYRPKEGKIVEMMILSGTLSDVSSDEKTNQ